MWSLYCNDTSEWYNWRGITYVFDTKEGARTFLPDLTDKYETKKVPIEGIPGPLVMVQEIKEDQ